MRATRSALKMKRIHAEGTLREWVADTHITTTLATSKGHRYAVIIYAHGGRWTGISGLTARETWRYLDGLETGAMITDLEGNAS